MVTCRNTQAQTARSLHTNWTVFLLPCMRWVESTVKSFARYEMRALNIHMCAPRFRVNGLKMSIRTKLLGLTTRLQCEFMCKSTCVCVRTPWSIIFTGEYVHAVHVVRSNGGSVYVSVQGKHHIMCGYVDWYGCALCALWF